MWLLEDLSLKRDSAMKLTEEAFTEFTETARDYGASDRNAWCFGFPDMANPELCSALNMNVSLFPPPLSYVQD